MNLAEDTGALSKLAADYVRQLQEFVELLEHEQSVLKKRDYQNLDACTQQKEILLDRLEQLGKQRTSLVQQAEPAGNNEMQKGLDEKISSLLNKCRDLNVVNGGIVEISKQFNQRILNTILGASTPEDNLYDSTGNNAGNNLKQVFAKI